MHGDALLAVAAGTAAEFAEAGFGVFQFAVWVGVRGWWVLVIAAGALLNWADSQN